jgi:hypothetical protein
MVARWAGSEEDEQNIFCSKFILGAVNQSYMEFAAGKIYFSRE